MNERSKSNPTHQIQLNLFTFQPWIYISGSRTTAKNANNNAMCGTILSHMSLTPHVHEDQFMGKRAKPFFILAGSVANWMLGYSWVGSIRFRTIWTRKVIAIDDYQLHGCGKTKQQIHERGRCAHVMRCSGMFVPFTGFSSARVCVCVCGTKGQREGPERERRQISVEKHKNVAFIFRLQICLGPFISLLFFVPLDSDSVFHCLERIHVH